MGESMSDIELAYYRRLPATGPIESRLGRAIISLVEPHLGREREYNRWYEDDHLIVSAMGCPWVFSGKRWVATRALRSLRLAPADFDRSSLDLGCYLAAYWILDGRYEEFLAWAQSLVTDRLMPIGRMSPARSHVFTNDQCYVASVYRDAAGPREIHALDYPFNGLVLETIDADSPAARPELERWLTDEHIPGIIKDSPARICSMFRTTVPPKPRASIAWYDCRVTLMWFFDDAPARGWPHRFAEEEERMRRRNLGRLALVAPFVPVVPGTDRYVDELR
jgi:hypothetical protein